MGLIDGEGFLDWQDDEDVAADVDLNVVMNDRSEASEIQGTAESGSFSRSQLNHLLDLAESGIRDRLVAQQQAASE